MKKRAEEKKLEEEAEERLASLCKVGDRCEVSVPNQPKRRATILYVGQWNPNTFEIIYIIFTENIFIIYIMLLLGKTEFKEGWWIGVKYDEPLGKNDGR